MSIVRYDPVSETMQQMRHQLFHQHFEQPYEESQPTAGNWSPLVDVFEDNEGITLKVELPEVDANDIDIQLEGNALTLRGERKLENVDKKEGYHRVERSYGAFGRRFTLPSTVETGNVTAQSRDGVLRIFLPKKAEQAERDVTKAQKGLADAQARLVGERAKAEQAQSDALQMGRDSQRRGALLQEQATQLQGEEARQRTRVQQANQQAWMKTRNIRGAIAAVDANALTVRSDDQGDLRLQVSESTAVNLDGQAVTMKEIKDGSDVRASYGFVDGQAMAVRLDVTSSEASRSNDSAPASPK